MIYIYTVNKIYINKILKNTDIILKAKKLTQKVIYTAHKQEKKMAYINNLIIGIKFVLHTNRRVIKKEYLP